jgi:hypothetical protein
MTYSLASAQKKKTHFQSVNTFELINGEKGFDIGYQTVNGIRFSNWFSGIGVGVDNYHYNTLPLFADGRWFFGNDKKGFVYGDLGYNFPLKNKPGKEVDYYTYYDSYNFSGGIYTGFGIGFITKLFNQSSLLLSVGHSYKQLKSKIGISPACEECTPYYYDYKYSYGRIILKAGIEF